MQKNKMNIFFSIATVSILSLTPLLVSAGSIPTLHGTAQTKIVAEYKNIDSTTLHKIEQLKQQYNTVSMNSESNGLYELTITFPASQDDIVVERLWVPEFSQWQYILQRVSLLL